MIAGHAEAIEVSLPMLKAGVRSVRYPACERSIPLRSHETGRRPIKDELDAIDVQVPTVPVIQNVSIRPEKNKNVAVIRTQLIRQTFSPIRWNDSPQL